MHATGGLSGCVEVIWHGVFGAETLRARSDCAGSTESQSMLVGI